LSYSSYNRLIAGNFDHATNLLPNPTNFAHEIRIRRMRILAGSVTSLRADIGQLYDNTQNRSTSNLQSEVSRMEQDHPPISSWANHCIGNVWQLAGLN